MKITKSQLQQIIKEELSKFIKEDTEGMIKGLKNFPPDVQRSIKKQNGYLGGVRREGGDVWDHVDGVIKFLKEKHPDHSDALANYYYTNLEG